jgi:hypothetical protein
MIRQDADLSSGQTETRGSRQHPSPLEKIPRGGGDVQERLEVGAHLHLSERFERPSRMPASWEIA